MNEVDKRLGRVGLVPKGKYSELVEYKRLDLAHDSMGSYISLQDNNVGHPLSDPAWWMPQSNSQPLLDAEGKADAATKRATEAAINAEDTDKRIKDAEAVREVGENERISAENLRVAEERRRSDAETLRKQGEDVRKTNETLRVNAERSRMTAESERVNTEALRVTEEQSRATAEDVRNATEAGRKTAEQRRDIAETNRVNAEQSRANAEAGRTNAESDRVTAETLRVTEEGNRVKAEQDRATAEGERVKAEQSRVTAEQNRVTEFNQSKQSADTAAANANDAAKIANDAAANANKATGNMQKYVTEYNVSRLYPNKGIGGTDKYDLLTAIAALNADPSIEKSVGIKCSFVTSEGIPETWIHHNAEFTDKGSWRAIKDNNIHSFIEMPEKTTGNIVYKAHEFNATGRSTIKDGVDKWYIYDSLRIRKTGVRLTKFLCEYMKGNLSCTYWVAIFSKNAQGIYRIEHMLYGNNNNDLRHNGSITLPSELGGGWGNSQLSYDTPIHFLLKKGYYVGIRPRVSWVTAYRESKDGAYQLTENGDGTYTAVKTDIFCGFQFETTDVEIQEETTLITKENIAQTAVVLPAIIKRSRKFQCTQATKILLLGDSIASDTMMGGSVKEHNYNGYQKALANELNIPESNIIRAGNPGCGTGYFSSDVAWKTNGDKSVEIVNPDIIISIVGANESGEPWTVGTFSGVVDGEPIVPDIPFDKSTESQYGRKGYTHFIQSVSWIVQRYINTYYDIRKRANVLSSDNVEQADTKMASVKVPRLIICTTLPQKRSGEYAMFSKPENWKRKRDAVVEVCNKYNIECVDLLAAQPWDESKEPEFGAAVWENKGIYTMDGLHPNHAGFRVIAGIICNEAGLIRAL